MRSPACAASSRAPVRSIRPPRQRRFTIGAPDGASAVFLPSLLADLRRSAPGVDIAVRQLLPVPGALSPARAWQAAFAELEARAMDIAVLPADEVPLRFSNQLLYAEGFVLVMRRAIRSSLRPPWRGTATPSICWCRSPAMRGASSTTSWRSRGVRGALP
jgi:DNA-binding transcriptional LysR family regulator